MAGPLAAIERFFERLLERPAARLFQARLEPIHLQRQLERTMEAERRLGARRTYVPSNYRVMLNPTDMTVFEGFRDSLAADLAEALHGHARSRAYTLTARPTVEIVASADIPAGDVIVVAQAVSPPRDRRGAIDRVTQRPPRDNAAPAAAAGTAEHASATVDDRPATADERRAAADERQATADERQATADERQATADERQATADERQATADEAPATPPRPPATPPPVPETADEARAPAAPTEAGRASGPRTSVYAAPQTSLPNAVLAVRVAGQPVSRVRMSSGNLRVGRSLDNDIVLADDRVSRHHGQFSVRFGTLVYSDLNSTNGSYLNGTRVTEIALGPGDVLQLGGSTLAVEQGD